MLESSPDRVRSGIIHSGRIYETDGGNPVGVHETRDVRPLPPVGVPPSIRIFRNPELIGEEILSEDLEALRYEYSNPSALVGPNYTVPMPDFAPGMDVEVYVAAIVGEDSLGVTIDQADQLILGVTILMVFVARNIERHNGSARARDFLLILGPVLTTPDELDDQVIHEGFGRRYSLDAVLRVNGVEKLRGTTNDLPVSLAQAVYACSGGAPLKSGEIIAVGPLWKPESLSTPIDHGDEVQVSIDNLGTLTTRIATPAQTHNN